MTEDESICVMRPKHFVGSSGTVWASEDRRLRFEKPQLYEVRTSEMKTAISPILHGIAVHIRDKTVHFQQQTINEDLLSVTEDEMCVHRTYEIGRLSSFHIHLSDCEKRLRTYTFENTVYEVERAKCLFEAIQKTTNKVKETKQVLDSKDILDITSLYEILLEECSSLIQTVCRLKLPATKPRVLELTDAGPGVGISNKDVKFRAAEKVMIDNLDFYSRVHRATGDCQNEVERTQAAVGKALVDGGSIHWEHKKIDLQNENVKQMTAEELDSYETEIIKHNVVETCKELARRVDDSPGPRGGFMTGYYSHDSSSIFFPDAKYLRDYLDAPPTKRPSLPGNNYYRKIIKFYDNHFYEGELYIEYLRFSCEELIGDVCDFCLKGWSGKPLSHVPRPFPNGSSGDYKAYSDTPLRTEHGKQREPDDFQPRAQIKKLHAAGVISSTEEEAIKEFGEKYAVKDLSLVKKELDHLEYIHFKRMKRSDDRKRQNESERNKPLKDFDWTQLHKTGKINKLTVGVLNRYITENDLCTPLPRKKSEKVSIVEAHISRRIAIHQHVSRDTEKKSKHQRKQITENESDDSEDNSGDSSEEDILEEIDSDSDSGSESDTERKKKNSVAYTNRFGRTVAHWKNRKFYGDSDSDN